ncbi:MAG: bile acid:sodium symporter family protein [Defluviicoccus sp.]|nr:bile acid:sodium symporter family protein [Defluviicoccus sp.]
MGFLVDVVLPLALAFIMLALGLGLTFDDFARVVRRPRDFAVGALSQIVVLPAVAFALASVWPMAPELALGLMIIAAAPGGVTSNILTAFARGDVALSISLTAVISLVSVITIPIIVVFAYARFIGEQAGKDISVAGTALGVFLIVAVPVLIGLIVRRFAESFALRFEPAARKISSVLFVLVLAGAIYDQRANIVPYFAQAGLVTLVLNLLMMTIAWLLARMFATGPTQRIAIAIECGLQNGTLAIAVAVLLFGGGLATVPAATYSLIMFATALIYIAVLRRGSA